MMPFKVRVPAALRRPLVAAALIALGVSGTRTGQASAQDSTKRPATKTVAPPATKTGAPPATKAAPLPETKPVAPPETKVVTPPATKPVAPPETKVVTPPATKTVTPPATKTVAPETKTAPAAPAPVQTKVVAPPPVQTKTAAPATNAATTPVPQNKTVPPTKTQAPTKATAPPPAQNKAGAPPAGNTKAVASSPAQGKTATPPPAQTKRVVLPPPVQQPPAKQVGLLDRVLIFLHLRNAEPVKPVVVTRTAALPPAPGTSTSTAPTKTNPPAPTKTTQPAPTKTAQQPQTSSVAAGQAKTGAAPVTTPQVTKTAAAPPPAQTKGAPPPAATKGAAAPKLNVVTADTAFAQPLIIMREVFSYEPAGRRDPFVSLLTTTDLRPTLNDLKLLGTVVDEPGRSVALLMDAYGKKQVTVRVGTKLGRMRVTSIKANVVVFTIENFGMSRSDSLLLRETKVRGR